MTEPDSPTPQIDRRHAWRTTAAAWYGDIERVSKGLEYWSALRFQMWGVYFLVDPPPAGDNPILRWLTSGPVGGVLVLLLGLAWLACLLPCGARPALMTRIVVRKFGCTVALALSFSLSAATAIAVARGTLVPGGYISLLSLAPFVFLMFVALLRPPLHYRTGG